MLLQQRLKFCSCRKRVVIALPGAFGSTEPAPLEFLEHTLLLLTPLKLRLVVEIDENLSNLAVNQQKGAARGAISFGGVVKLPLGSGHWRIARMLAIVFVQNWRAEPRPEQHNDDVRIARRWNVLLRRFRSGQRLFFGKHGLDVAVICELLLESFDDTLRREALLSYVHRR